MRMSANENESVDIHLYANRRSNSIDWEDINRMERPSRVFNSRHNLMPPAVGGWSHLHPIEQTEQYRRPRDNPYYYETPYTSARTGGGTVSGDTVRNRSPFVRFTITDPETQQITAAGQIPLNSPPTTTQANIITSNSELIVDDPINETSDDEYINLNIRRHVEQHRRYVDHFNAMAQTPQQLRNSRSGRRSRRYTEHPYFIRNNLDNNPSNNRTHYNRRVRFSSTNRGYNDHPPERSQTPEQELPEILEQDMEPENLEEVYLGQESISSVSSHNDADSGDDRRFTQFSPSENQNSQHSNADEDNIDTSNETPRTRVVPFIMSPMPIPIPFSPQTDPPDPLDTPSTSVNNNISTALQFDNMDDNHIPVFMELESPLLTPFVEYNEPRISFMSIRSSGVHNNDANSRITDADLSTVNNTDNEIVNTLNTTETVVQVNDDNQNILRPPPLVNASAFASIAQRDEQSAVAEETAAVQHAKEHPESYEELIDQLTRLFECPVCFEHIVPPIFQCLFGHLICNKCVLMCENCPTCRNPFNSKRNLYMEKVGYLIKFPCKNALTGCKQQMFLSQKETHEQDCCYRHYQCFFTNCTWKGYYPELHVHMINNHSSYILNGSDRTFDIFMPNNNQTYKWFLLAHSEYFAVIAQILTPRSIKIQVNFLGPDIKAKQYKFKIILIQQKSLNNISQKLTYERTTLPYSDIHDISNNNVLKKDTFSLTGDLLEQFIRRRQRRRLPINLKIDPISSL